MLRSFGPFNFKTKILFSTEQCSAKIEANKSKKNRRKIFEVQSLTVKDTILRYAIRRNDSWGFVVISRIESAIYLIAAEARYHIPCYHLKS